MQYNCYPVDYINITQPYIPNQHYGVDFGWWGTTSDRPIYAVNSGIVTAIRNDYNTTDTSGNSYGNYVYIMHDNGIETRYAHLKYQSVLVNPGDRVSFHEHIATLGNTGYSTGPHLHFEVLINNVKVNPFDYIYRYPSFQDLNNNQYAYLVTDVPVTPTITGTTHFKFNLFGYQNKLRRW